MIPHFFFNSNLPVKSFRTHTYLKNIKDKLLLIIPLVFLISTVSFTQELMSDSTLHSTQNEKIISKKKSSLIFRAGLRLGDSKKNAGTRTTGGIYLDAGLNLHFGKYWYLRGGISYWKGKTKDTNESVNAVGIHGLFGCRIYLTDEYSLILGTGAGSFQISDGSSSRPGVILESNLSYSLNEAASLWLGVTYQHITPFSFGGGGGRTYSPTIISFGFNHYL